MVTEAAQKSLDIPYLTYWLQGQVTSAPPTDFATVDEIDSSDANLRVHEESPSTLHEVLEEIIKKWKNSTKTHAVIIAIVTTVTRWIKITVGNCQIEKRLTSLCLD